MLKNIIFDFGDVFINLDKQATSKENTVAAIQLGMHIWNLDPDKESILDLLKRKEFFAIDT